MSSARRAYDLLRGYVNREWDRIRDVEFSDAERELNDAMDRPAPRPVAGSDSQDPILRGGPISVNREERARQILGCSKTDNFEEIRHAFQRLNRRSDPGNFPEGSAEANNAAEIQRRVQWAFSVLTENMDHTERRFKSLEID